jgi:hypothetical protein
MPVARAHAQGDARVAPDLTVQPLSGPAHEGLVFLTGNNRQHFLVERLRTHLATAPMGVAVRILPRVIGAVGGEIAAAAVSGWGRHEHQGSLAEAPDGHHLRGRRALLPPARRLGR